MSRPQAVKQTPFLGNCARGFPTDPFTTFDLQNPSHDILELHTIRRSPDFEALKYLVKQLVGLQDSFLL